MPAETIPPVEVRCHSGYTYEQRPVEIQAGGRVYRVESVTAEGRTPEGKWFQVVTACGRHIKLVYHPAEDNWSASGLDSAYNKK